MPSLAFIVLLIFAGALVEACVIGDTALRAGLMGGALSMATTAVGFYFGSSVGSQKKDETIAKAASDLAISTPPSGPSNG